ncbi:MAG: Flp pilus assembly complex ATPase component TadA [Candidatus Omnitrophica bacterium]|nr:Flp pilus assembly complex ATPase component TadA [Candidatus Omnitrophota bacterium]
MLSYHKLGEILLEKGAIKEEQLQEALAKQKINGRQLGDVLLELGFIKESDIIEGLGKQLNIPYASLSEGVLKPNEQQELDKLIPESLAREHCLIPISKHLNSLTIAFADPLDLVVQDNVRRMTKCGVNPLIASRNDIEEAIDSFYGKRDLLREVIEQTRTTTGKKSGKSGNLDLNELVKKAEEAPVIRLVNLLFKQAIDERASDIHVEPLEGGMSIRYRVDGALYKISPPDEALLPAMVSRIKILSGLDIAERRLPQDGGFSLTVKARKVDTRVSTMPTVNGEKVVVRILDKASVPLDLKQLGFESADLEKFSSAINQPYGLVFLTGPTGSGKTTTLYAALSQINSPRKNLITVEDPVEYHLEGVNQVQVRPNIGLTFASGLRSFLRQDPDIMMVGEVRDLETAEICIQAALTGHFVLSTLHTNDAPGAISRLIDIGVEPFLLSASLSLVVAQRLVRCLCPKCKKLYEPDAEEKEKIGFQDGEKFYQAGGCKECHFTGYKGRTSIHEVMAVDTELKHLIWQGKSDSILKEAAVKSGMVTLQASGFSKIRAGITTVEEVLAVTGAG